jgi:glycerophosphoryl diester phosphodiesterase
LDAGTWFQPPYPSVKIPSLVQAIEYIQKGSVTLIERKAGDAPTCVNLLRDRQWINQVVVQSFDWNYLRTFHELAPEQVLGALGPPGNWNGKKLSDSEKELSEFWIQEIQTTGARIVVWNRLVTPKAVALAQSKGFKVWIYTVNDAATAKTLLDAGVDGIITDHPALIWQVLAERAYAKAE